MQTDRHEDVDVIPHGTVEGLPLRESEAESSRVVSDLLFGHQSQSEDLVAALSPRIPAASWTTKDERRDRKRTWMSDAGVRGDVRDGDRDGDLDGGRDRLRRTFSVREYVEMCG